MKRLGLFLILMVFAVNIATAQVGTTFTYQGYLENGGAPVAGLVSLRFSLYDDPTAGTQVGTTQDALNLTAKSGLVRAELDFGDVWNGGGRWLEVAVDSDGGSDNFVALADRIHVLPVPYAIYAAEAGTATNVLNDEVNDADADPTNELQDLTLSGSVLTLSGDATVVDLADGFWSTTGNDVLTTGAAYLGTTTEIPLDLKVLSEPALRLATAVDNDGTRSPNLIVGSPDVALVENDAAGALVTSGDLGTTDFDFSPPIPAPNAVGGNYSVVVGGRFNYAGLPGGAASDGDDSGVFAGTRNFATGDDSVVLGGAENEANASQSAVLGGQINSANGEGSAVVGGEFNFANAIGSAIVGGIENYIEDELDYEGDGSFIGGGFFNYVAAPLAAVLGGSNNEVDAPLAAVVGGLLGITSGELSVIAGGFNNTIDVDGTMSFLGGGYFNQVNGPLSAIIAGEGNEANGYVSFAAGSSATADHDYTFVWSDGTTYFDTGSNFASTGTEQFLIEAIGGVGINTNAPQSALDVRGDVRFGGSGELTAAGAGNQNSLRIVTGQIAANGDISGGTGDFTVSLSGNEYTISFDADFSTSGDQAVFSSTPTVTATASETNRVCFVISASSSQVVIETRQNDNNDAEQSAINFIAIGLR